ncbi:MAG: beta-lactamase family protein, partial [Chitinophagaceae bacterium]|nr:beta-lactamase family protein [Chitinophagaceae bacterium]
ARLEKIKSAFPAIDSMFRLTAEKNHFPGLAYGIVVDGKLVHAGNYGYTDVEKKIPVTSSSVFRIASMSKSFTAMAILHLRDAGKLELDDPAYLYVPELKKLKYASSDAPAITVRHLLTHSAGFPEDNPWGDRQLADTDKELIALIEKQISFSNSPGVAFEYSNLGFALLGKIVTAVSGKPYQQYIKENIWQPLGMKTAEWEYGNVAPDKLAHGYRWLNEKWNEETLLHDTPDGSWGSMGGMMCSIEEFANYMGLHLSAWPASNAADPGPIKRSSVREMHHPWRFTALNPNYKYNDGRSCPIVAAYCYGLGWTRDCEGRVYIAHSGGLPGFGSQWRIMPDYGIGIVAFANRTYAGVGGVNMQVLDTLIKIAGLKPRELPPSKILQQRKEELIALLPDWNNAEKSGLFAENFFADFPIDSLKKQSRELFAKAGRIVSIQPIIPENQLRGVFTVQGEKTDFNVYFTLSPENPALIQQYEIWEKPKQ